MNIDESKDGLEALFDMQQVVLAMVDFKFNCIMVVVGKDSHFDMDNVDHLSQMNVVSLSLLYLVVLPLSLVLLIQKRQDVLELLQNLGAHRNLVVTHLLVL